MRYHVLASDYDGTLAHHGAVDEPTLAAVRRLKESGRKFFLVTGRELDELLTVFPQIDICDRVIAENGAMIYIPKTKEKKLLAERPPDEFVTRLKKRGVERISAGHVIVATWEPHQEAVLETIHDMALELQVIFNKGAVMVLPSGINKATGMIAALKEMGLSAHNVVGVGDAENDHAFMNACECAVAVSNALPALKDRADLTTEGDHGRGVTELIEQLLKDDLAVLTPKLTRRRVLIGQANGEDVKIDPYGANILIAGTSGGGKSTYTTGLLERLCEQNYQFVVVDPEGDYSEMDIAVSLGNAQAPASVDEVLEVVGETRKNATVNLLGLSLDHRPAYFAELLPRLMELRSRTGRPHWIVIDEAHHLLPTEWQPASQTIPASLQGIVYITVHPEAVSPLVRERAQMVIAVGREPDKTIAAFCDASKELCPVVPKVQQLTRGDVMVWKRGDKEARLMHTPRSKNELKRHSRKYAEGMLDPERSFYFTGPDAKLHLKAHNLFIFLQMSDGVDDETWQYHRERGDFSTWMGAAGVKDDSLAAEVKQVEQDWKLDAKGARTAIRKAIEQRYTLPENKPSGKIDQAEKVATSGPQG